MWICFSRFISYHLQLLFHLLLGLLDSSRQYYVFRKQTRQCWGSVPRHTLSVAQFPFLNFYSFLLLSNKHPLSTGLQTVPSLTGHTTESQLRLLRGISKKVICSCWAFPLSLGVLSGRKIRMGGASRPPWISGKESTCWGGWGRAMKGPGSLLTLGVAGPVQDCPCLDFFF